MADVKCKHYGTMTLMPTAGKSLEVLDWCFYQECKIKGECPKDCLHKDKPEG